MEDDKKYYTIQMRITRFQFSKFDEGKKKGITGKMIIQALCQQSSEMEITVFDKKKKQSITLPKGFLCKK